MSLVDGLELSRKLMVTDEALDSRGTTDTRRPEKFEKRRAKNDERVRDEPSSHGFLFSLSLSHSVSFLLHFSFHSMYDIGLVPFFLFCLSVCVSVWVCALYDKALEISVTLLFTNEDMLRLDCSRRSTQFVCNTRIRTTNEPNTKKDQRSCWTMFSSWFVRFSLTLFLLDGMTWYWPFPFCWKYISYLFICQSKWHNWVFSFVFSKRLFPREFTRVRVRVRVKVKLETTNQRIIDRRPIWVDYEWHRCAKISFRASVHLLVSCYIYCVLRTVCSIHVHT